MVVMTTQMFDKIVELTGKNKDQLLKELSPNFSEQYMISSSEIGDLEQIMKAKSSSIKTIQIK